MELDRARAATYRSPVIDVKRRYIPWLVGLAVWTSLPLLLAARRLCAADHLGRDRLRALLK